MGGLVTGVSVIGECVVAGKINKKKIVLGGFDLLLIALRTKFQKKYHDTT